MLRPVLLLCWAATIVSAGGQKSNISNQTVPANPVDYNAATISSTALPELNTKETKLSLISDNISNKDDATEPSSNHPLSTISSNDQPPPTKTTIPITSTTTLAPTSTTSAPMSTTPVPTPLPPPDTGKWSLKENNTLCVIVQMAVQLNVSYIKADNTTSHKALDVPASNNDTSAIGKCGKTEQNMTLSWKSQNNTWNNFTIHFVKNETEKYYSLHHFEISLAAAEFPNAKSNKTVTLVHVAPSFKTGLSNSYRCIKEQHLDLTQEGKNVTVGLLKVSHLQFQAFRGDNSTIFGLAKDCSFDTPDIVPITVGCALAGLVVIVLIAYLVGRRRTQVRGYLSM
ncbi:lysosome-associated membrane glycoprotein 1 [Monomorium pharaonis]|uniref:lysosome-associated membrane glycoprotein 1 n=1 Tax=Monomorium pharaonis TaxID=307658 RepID=UPI00063EE51B|nr:lysosome-associated membrane glycoprotein 1 [Monomorium pharaonis]